MIRWTNSGTNTGLSFGNPPTGKRYIVTGFDLDYFEFQMARSRSFGNSITLPTGNK